MKFSMKSSPLNLEPRPAVVRSDDEDDEVIAVSLQGDIDLRSAPALRSEIDRALAAGKDLILDLSEATFVDSSVIHTLIYASTVFGDKRRTVVLQLGTAAIVERALEIVAIEKVMSRAQTRPDAVEIIRATRGAVATS